jgi:hypothetical protein
MNKIIVLGAAAAGYVLGSRAGRERYEQIRENAKRAWSDPRVQRGADRARETAQEAGDELRNRVAEHSSGPDGNAPRSTGTAYPSSATGGSPGRA